MQVSDIFYLTVSFKFINFSFQIFFPFVPEKSASFIFYIVDINYIALVCILHSLNLGCFISSKNLSIFHQTVVYSVSVHTELDSR
jgi:hypothetical protein